jgi:hypothetical protein
MLGSTWDQTLGVLVFRMGATPLGQQRDKKKTSWCGLNPWSLTPRCKQSQSAQNPGKTRRYQEDFTVADPSIPEQTFILKYFVDSAVSPTQRSQNISA